MFSDDVVIRLRGAGKRYNLYDQPIDRLKQALNNRLLPARLHKRYYREHWAVRGVDLDVGRGETVGIVGANGSGKSTLLQMICGTLQPTEGDIQVAGRIAPLLQLGAGFNPEFTGRENVRLNAGILGLSDAEIDARFDAIVAFADIGDMLERPVKLYSSGMYARLAFAVAINVDPDILVIDESLAVGDEAFQFKCFARIRAMKDAGVTILFVSHSRAAILELCSRAILLDGGCKLVEGEPKPVMAAYQRLSFAPPREKPAIREAIARGDMSSLVMPPELRGAERLPNSGIGDQARYDPALERIGADEWRAEGARISRPCIRTLDGQRVNVLISGREYVYEYTVAFEQESVAVVFGMLVKSMMGQELSGIGSLALNNVLPEATKGSAYRVRFRFRNAFAPGTYSVNAGCMAIVNGEYRYLHRLIDAVAFRVVAADRKRTVSGYFDIWPDADAVEVEALPCSPTDFTDPLERLGDRPELDPPRLVAGVNGDVTLRSS